MSLAKRLTYKPVQYVPQTNIALVQTDQAHNSSASSSFVYTLPTLTVGNYFLLYVLTPMPGTQTWTLSGTNSGNYVVLENNRHASSAQFALFSKRVESGDSEAALTISNGYATSGYSVILREYSGVSFSQPLDVASTFSTSNATSVSSLTGPAITTVSDKDMLVGAWFQPLAAASLTSSWTQSDLTNGVTEISQIATTYNNANLFTADLLVDGPNIYGGYTANVSTNRPTASLLTALKPA